MSMFVQVLATLILMLLWLPVIALWVNDHVVRVEGSGVALIVWMVTVPLALIITFIGTLSSRRFRRNPFVWAITVAGVVSFIWMRMEIAKGF